MTRGLELRWHPVVDVDCKTVVQNDEVRCVQKLAHEQDLRIRDETPDEESHAHHESRCNQHLADTEAFHDPATGKEEGNLADGRYCNRKCPEGVAPGEVPEVDGEVVVVMIHHHHEEACKHHQEDELPVPVQCTIRNTNPLLPVTGYSRQRE